MSMKDLVSCLAHEVQAHQFKGAIVDGKPVCMYCQRSEAEGHSDDCEMPGLIEEAEEFLAI